MKIFLFFLKMQSCHKKTFEKSHFLYIISGVKAEKGYSLVNVK